MVTCDSTEQSGVLTRVDTFIPSFIDYLPCVHMSVSHTHTHTLGWFPITPSLKLAWSSS